MNDGLELAYVIYRTVIVILLILVVFAIIQM